MVIADIYDALVSKSSCKKSFTYEEAEELSLREIVELLQNIFI